MNHRITTAINNHQTTSTLMSMRERTIFDYASDTVVTEESEAVDLYCTSDVNFIKMVESRKT